MFRTRWLSFRNVERRARSPATRPPALETLETRALPSFFPAVPYATGILPVAAAVSDFNGDGRSDIVTASLDNPSQSVAVLLGNGDGTFQSARHAGVGVHLQSLALGDLNRDGRTDVVLANFTRHRVSVLLGNGDGSFQPAVNYSTSLSTRSVTIADFDGDTVPDLMTAHPGSNALNLLRGNGDGTFRDAEVVSLGAGVSPTAMTVGDFNRDGRTDVATANNLGQSVSVLLGNGDGTFQAPVNYALGEGPRILTAVDLNGDTLADLVVATPSAVFVLQGNGDGTFQGPALHSSGSGLSALAVADFNQDGTPDVARVSSQLNSVTVLGAAYAVGSTPGAVAVGDFNGDGLPDLVTANNGSHNVSVLLNAADWMDLAADVGRSAAPAGGNESQSSFFVPPGPATLRPIPPPGATDAVGRTGSITVVELLDRLVAATEEAGPRFTVTSSEPGTLDRLDNSWARLELS